jgi:hypothetical protein
MYVVLIFFFSFTRWKPGYILRLARMLDYVKRKGVLN